MAIFRISHHFQLVLMFTIFYNKKIFSLKSNICQQEKNQVPSNKQRKRVVWVGERRNPVPCFVSVIFFLFKDKAYIYMYYYCLNKKIMKVNISHSSQEKSEAFFPLVITALVMVGRYKVKSN